VEAILIPLARGFLRAVRILRDSLPFDLDRRGLLGRLPGSSSIPLVPLPRSFLMIETVMAASYAVRLVPIIAVFEIMLPSP